MTSSTRYPGGEPLFEVVWPLGKSAGGPAIKPSSPVTDLNGKTVADILGRSFKGDKMSPIIRERLRERFPNVRFADRDVFGKIRIHDADEVQVVAGLPALLHQHGVDVVIMGVGS
ncbi:MAG: hypothetical protein Q7O66_13005 [Dehalococcoidia bacterium]|nr:hypothetical protein [Dehalococcoidia bacterium]